MRALTARAWLVVLGTCLAAAEDRIDVRGHPLRVDAACYQVDRLAVLPACHFLFGAAMSAVTQMNAQGKQRAQLELVRVVSATEEVLSRGSRFRIDLLIGNSPACPNSGPPYRAHFEYVQEGRGQRVRCPVDKQSLRTLNVEVLATPTGGDGGDDRFTLLNFEATDAAQVLAGDRAEAAAERQEGNAIVDDRGDGRGGRAGGAAGYGHGFGGGGSATLGSGARGSSLATLGGGTSLHVRAPVRGRAPVGPRTGAPPDAVLAGSGGALIGSDIAARRRSWFVFMALVVVCLCCRGRRRPSAYAPVVSADFDMEAYRARMSQKYNLQDDATQPAQRFSV